MYFGGHVREEDEIESSSKNWLSISRYALHREVKEEINYDHYADAHEIPLCIWDKTNERSIKHLALCYVKTVNFDTFKGKLDTNEFIATGNTESGKILKVEEIAQDMSKLESWSKVILKEIFNISIDKGQMDLFTKNYIG